MNYVITVPCWGFLGVVFLCGELKLGVSVFKGFFFFLPMIDLKCIVELVKAVFLSLCRCFYLCLGKKKKKMDLCKYTVMWLGIVMWQCIFFHKKEGSCVDLCGVFHEGTWGSGAAGSKPCFSAQPRRVLPGLCAGLGAGSSCRRVLICCCGGLCQPLCATSVAILLM